MEGRRQAQPSPIEPWEKWDRVAASLVAVPIGALGGALSFATVAALILAVPWAVFWALSFSNASVASRWASLCPYLFIGSWLGSVFVNARLVVRLLRVSRVLAVCFSVAAVLVALLLLFFIMLAISGFGPPV